MENRIITIEKTDNIYFMLLMSKLNLLHRFKTATDEIKYLSALVSLTLNEATIIKNQFLSDKKFVQIVL